MMKENEKLIKQYQLSREKYVDITIIGIKKSYGSRQQWFSMKEPKSKSFYTHYNGCGVIALSDLFMYFALTRPDGTKTQAGELINKRGKVMKKEYMTFIEYIRDHYTPIFKDKGTFGWELVWGINRYCKKNNLPYRGKRKVNWDKDALLEKIKEQLELDFPTILIIGPSSFRKIEDEEKGVDFYKAKPVRLKDGKINPRKEYIQAERLVSGHYVTITGLIVDQKRFKKNERVMLKIASWGQEYYVSYREYIKYVENESLPGVSGIIYINDKTKIK